MAKSVWKNEFVIQTYELVKSGMTQSKVAQVLGVNFWTFRLWRKKKVVHLPFKMIVQAARKAYKGNNKKSVDWHDYVFMQLSDEKKELWRKINRCDSFGNGVERIEALFKDRGLQMRQWMFIHAWIVSNFSISQALRKVNVSKGTFDLWKRNDPGFVELCDEIRWHFKNWCQDHLIKLIVGGDTSATIFANRTLNADRFPDTKSVNMKVQGTVQHNVVDISKLKLPLKTRKEILKAMRQQSKTNNDTPNE